MSGTLTPTHAINRNDLAQFTGTTQYYRWLGGLVLTDGAHFLASNGAAWLLDVLPSVQSVPAVHAEERQFWTLSVDLEKQTGVVICTDGGKGLQREQEIYRQDIEYTDFPLTEIKLFAFHDAGLGRVVLLPSEY